MGGRGEAAEASAADTTVSSARLLLPRAPAPAVRDEVRRLVGLAAPLVACSLLQYSLQVVSVMFSGHLGELPLSAASFANFTCFSVLLAEGVDKDGQEGVKGCELVFKSGHFIYIYDLFSLEYWAFEMVVLLAGFLPKPKLETSILSISLNTMWMVYTIPSGLSSAIIIRVPNELGTGNPQAARLSVLISGIMCLAEGLLVVIITIFVRDVWGYLYSNEEEIVKYVSIMMPILATSNFMDGIQCTLSGMA